ncbi:MAG: hypothetical protein K2L11_07930 [Muribaculaceae bacterium]|nr:hypothetical protein [Muribaculaceae bacterium]
MINQHNLREYVNLHSYTDSVGWIGYYCRKGRFTPELKADSISRFIEYFQSISPEASVITSLYKYGKHEISPLPDEENLMRTGLLRQFSDKENINDTPVLYEDCGWNEIKLLSSIVMDNAGDIAGHCFIIINSLGLIAYTHDDTGFGFISIGSNGSAKDIVRKFLINLNPNQFQYEIAE